MNNTFVDIRNLPTYPVPTPTDIFANKAAYNVSMGALTALTASGRQQEKMMPFSFPRPPLPEKKVSLMEAEQAVNRVFKLLNSQFRQGNLPLSVMENASMEGMCLAATLLGVQALSDAANLKSMALKIEAKGAENLRLQQNEDLRKKIDKAIEDQSKAQKAGIIADVLDWTVSLAEVAVGVVKIVVGDYAGGAMDLSAGCAGLVKASCETLALLDPAHAKKYEEVENVAAQIQLGFEMAGAAVDLISIGRGLMAAKPLVDATKGAMEKGVGELLEDTLKQTGEKIANEVTQEVVSNVAEELANQVAKQVTEQITNNLSKGFNQLLGNNPLLKAFSEKAVREMICHSVEKAAEAVVKKEVEASAKAITKAVIKNLQREIVNALVKVSIKSTMNVTKLSVIGGATASTKIAQGVIAKERAELQKIIQTLINETRFIQFLLDEFEKTKKQAKNSISSLLDNANKMLSAGYDMQLKSSAMLSNIAANIA